MRPKLCVVVASEMTVRAFLLNQMQALSDLFDITVAVNTTNRKLLVDNGIQGEVEPVQIQRTISPLQDAIAAGALYRLFSARGFTAVHSVTPKAGLLAMTAAAAARVPLRVHTFTGQVWATRSGPSRALLKSADFVTARCASRILVDSESQRQFLIANRVVTPNRSEVLGSGSISGVDVDRFRPDSEARRRIRASLQIPGDAVVFLFVGRINRDKGVLDLAAAFARYRPGNDAFLVYVGPDEGGLRNDIVHAADGAGDCVRFVDYTAEPEAYVAAADVFCLPSYREGFGSSIIEAAAAGIPSIASRIYGVTDAVIDGRTGLLHAPGDVNGIAELMQRLGKSSGLRMELGTAARERAVSEFSQPRVTEALLNFYRGALVENGVAVA